MRPEAGILLGALLLPLAGPSAAFASGTDTITKTDLRSDPPAITDRRLRDMIWQMLQHQDFRTARGKPPPRAQLRSLWFHTKPIATDVPNLCRYDSVNVEFAPARHGTRDADTPVHPVGLTAHSAFHFLSPPPLETGDEETAERRLPTDGPCASLDPDKTDFFSADREEVARDGYVAFLKLQQALRGKQPVPLDCDLYDTDKQTCPDVILGLAPTSISDVATCDGGREEECYKVSVDEREIKILLAASSATKVPPGRVLRARLESMIVVADELID